MFLVRSIANEYVSLFVKIICNTRIHHGVAHIQLSTYAHGIMERLIDYNIVLYTIRAELDFTALGAYFLVASKVSTPLPLTHKKFLVVDVGCSTSSKCIELSYYLHFRSRFFFYILEQYREL